MMRRWLLSALLIIGWAWPAEAALSLIQSAKNAGTASLSTLAVTVTATASGSLLIVCASWRDAQTISSVTDGTNTYTQVTGAQAVFSVLDSHLDCWRSVNAAAGATSVTVTWTATVRDRVAIVWEVGGAVTTAEVDQVAVVNSGLSVNPSGGTVTTTNANDFIVGYLASDNVITGMLGGNAFIQDQNDAGGVLIVGVSGAHNIVSSTGTYTPQWSQGNSNFGAVTVAFKGPALANLSRSLLGVGR